jgi:DNA-directed RNA polymerase subunit E'/Rpb7
MDGNLYMDLGEKIRFIVQSVQFVTSQYETTAPKISMEESKPKFTSAPMIIQGRINGSGLGILRWWKEKESEDRILEDTTQ